MDLNPDKRLAQGRQESVILREFGPIETWSFKAAFYNLPNQSKWQHFILITTQLNFFLGTIQFYFVRSQLLSFVPFYVILDVIYLINIILMTIHKKSKYVKERLVVYVISKPLYYNDILSLLPQELIVMALFGIEAACWCRWFTYIRLRYSRMPQDEFNSVLTHRTLRYIYDCFITTFCLVHLFVCLWYHHSCHHGRCVDDETKIGLNGSSEWYKKTWAEPLLAKYPTFYNASSTEWYIVSFYAILQEYLSIGFGDVPPVNYHEMILMAVVMYLGSLICTILLPSYLFVIHFNWQRKDRHIYAFKVKSVNRFLKDVNVDSQTVKKNYEYCLMLWNKKGGVRRIMHMELLPTPLQMEIMYDINYIYLRRCMLFTNLKHYFFRTLSLIITTEFLLPGDILFYQDVVKKSMIIITRGVLEILSEEDGTSPVIAFKAGTVLGEASLFLTLPSRATVRAAVYTEVIFIERVEFTRKMVNFLDHFNILRNKILQRVENVRKRKEIAKEASVRLDGSQPNTFVPIKIMKEVLHARLERRMLKYDPGSAEAMFNQSMMGLYQISDVTSNIEPAMVIITWKFPWIIDCNSKLMMFWELLVIFAHMSFLIIYPYQVVFLRHLDNALFNLRLLSDIVCVGDVIALTCTSVVLRDRVLKTFREIVRVRLKSVEFYINMLPIFPYEYLVHLIDLEEDTSMRYYDLLWSIKMFRLIRCFSLIEKYREEYYFQNSVAGILFMIIFTSLCIYYSACLLYLYTCLFDVCTENSWFFQLIIKAVKLREENPCYFYPAASSIYFSSNIILGLGLGDIVPILTNDLGICLIIIISGYSFMLYIKGFVTNIMHNSSNGAEMYKDSITSLRRYLHQYRVPEDQQYQALDYFLLQWDYDRGEGRLFFDETAPSYLKMIVYKKELSQVLARVPLFQQIDLDFLMKIILSVKVQVLPAGATICFSGDVDREMFVILKGNCIATDSKGAFLKNLGKRDYFGDVEMLFNLKKMFSVITITHCKIACLTYRAYTSSLGMFPEEMTILNDVLNSPDMIESVDKMAQQRQQAASRKRKTLQYTKTKKYFTKFASSFIMSYRRAKETNGRETYWHPFEKMKRWQFFGLLLVPITINPNSWSLKVWFFFRFFLICAMGVVFPIVIGLPPAGNMFFFVLQAVEVTAYLEIYLLLHVAYYDDNGLLISHPMLTAKHYLTHGFLLDLVAALPYYYILSLTNPNHDDLVDPLMKHVIPHYKFCPWRAMSLLQCHRLLGALIYLRKNIEVNNLFVFCYICTILYLALILSMTVFIKNSAYHFFTEEQSQYANFSSLVYNSNSGNLTYYGYLISKHSWFSTLDFKEDPWFLTVMVYYFTFNVFNIIGIGDITAHDDINMYLVIIVNIFGILMICYITAFWWKEARRTISQGLRYQQKLVELMQFLKREKMSENLINKVMKYFEYVYNRTKGLEKREMMSELYSAIKGEICLYLYEKPLKETVFFKKIGRPYLRVLSKQFREEYFMKGDLLIKCYDVHSNIYIILRGQVEILTPYHDIITTLGVGGVVGNMHSSALGCSSISVRAQRNVDVLTISSVDFYDIMLYYPSVRKAVKRVLNTNFGEYIEPAAKSKSYQEDVDSEDFDAEAEELETLERVQSLTEADYKKRDQFPYKNKIVVPESALGTFLLFCKPKYWCKIAIEPTHVFFSINKAIVTTGAYYQLIIIPYMFVTQYTNNFLLISSFVIEPLFYLRIFFFFHEAYMDKYGFYIKNNKIIASHYISNRKRLALDIVPNVPLYLLFGCFKSDHFYWFSLMRMFQILRFIYVFNYYKMIRLALMSSQELTDMLFLFLFTILTLHYCSLCFYFIQTPHEMLSDTSKEIISNSSPFGIYWYCLYFVVNVISKAGNGDIIPHTKVELLFTMFLIILGIGFTIYLYQTFLAGFIVMHIHILNYQDKVLRMKNFLLHRGISTYLLDKMYIYMSELYALEKGVQIPELLDKKTPYVLKCKIMTKLYSHHLNESYIFRNISQALLMQICGHLKRVVFFKGNYIIQNGDTDASMYWIHKGLVSVLTVHPNLTETKHETLNEHDMFGLVQGLNYGLNHKFSYRAETICEILILCLPEWEAVLEHFPHDKDIIFRRLAGVYSVV